MADRLGPTIQPGQWLTFTLKEAGEMAVRQDFLPCWLCIAEQQRYEAAKPICIHRLPIPRFSLQQLSSSQRNSVQSGRSKAYQNWG